jgi:ketosteroid isomerase-like protein
MFPTFLKPLRMRLPNLMIGFVLAVLTFLANAQTLEDIQSLMKQGNLTQALEQVDSYIATQPRDAQGPFTKGVILTEMGRPTEAIVVFTGLTENFPELPEPYNNLAVLYAQQKQYDKARTALEMAIRTHPSYAVAYENLGDVYAKLASQAYDKALQLDSANAAAQNKLALIRDMVSAPTRLGSRPETPRVAAATPPPTPTPVVPPTPTETTPIAPATPVAPPMPTETVPVAPAAIVMPVPDNALSASPESGNTDKPAVPQTGALQEIQKTIAAWAAAWSGQDVKAYLAFYAPAFKTPNGASRENWETERKERLSRPQWIRVSYENLQITLDGNRATAHFLQHYRASSFKESSDKTLVLTRSDNAWLILEENAR